MSQSLAQYLDLADPAVRIDPYAAYARIRETAPIIEYAHGAWLVSGYEPAKAVLTYQFFETIPESSQHRGVLFLLEATQHRWLRALLARALARRLSSLRVRIRQLAEQLVTRLAEIEYCDMVEELAAPLPIMVICDILGVSTDEVGELRRRSADVTKLLDPHPDSVTTMRAVKSGLSLFRLADEFVSDAQSHPRAGLLRDLLYARADEPRLTIEMIRSTVVMFLVAGHETTTNLIGNGLYCLLRNQKQFAALRSKPSLIRKAVEEMLRYDSPVQTTRRIAHRECYVNDSLIRRGDSLLVLIGAANRDPKRFPMPDELNVYRNDAPHLSFSAGAHACLGAQLGRYEAQCAIDAVGRHLPRLRLGGNITYREHFAMRGLTSLPCII